MDKQGEGATEVGFSMPARLAAAAVVGVFLAIFLLQLAAIDHQRRIAASQSEAVDELLVKTRAAESAARPALDAARRTAPSLERAGRAAAKTLAAADPLVGGLVGADAPGALRRLDALASGLLEVDAPGAVSRGELVARRAAALLEELSRTGAARTLTRLELLPELVRLQRRSLAVQNETLAVQRRSVEILTRSLAVQEETLVHARSLDRKTGGPVAGSR